MNAPATNKWKLAITVGLVLLTIAGCSTEQRQSVACEDSPPPAEARLRGGDGMASANYLGPCYGYHPTCWRAWPDYCPQCPPPPQQLAPVESAEGLTTPPGAVQTPPAPPEQAPQPMPPPAGIPAPPRPDHEKPATDKAPPAATPYPPPTSGTDILSVPVIAANHPVVAMPDREPLPHAAARDAQSWDPIAEKTAPVRTPPTSTVTLVAPEDDSVDGDSDAADIPPSPPESASCEPMQIALNPSAKPRRLPMQADSSRREPNGGGALPTPIQIGQ